MTTIEQLTRWASEHAGLLAAVAVGSGILLILGLLALPWVLVRLPADHFMRPPERRSLVTWLLRNLFGSLVLLSGFLMLFLPGQGLLTILAGLMLVDFPGKRRLELLVLRQPGIRATVDRIRRRADRLPLELPQEGES